MTVWIASILAFGAAGLGTYILSRPTSPFRILDYPNERSLHSEPVPRTGGLAIWTAVVVALMVTLSSDVLSSELMWIAGAAFIVGAVSFIDDRSHVPAWVRFVSHLIAAVLLMLGGLHMSSIAFPGVELELPVGGALVLSVLFIVWMTNLYNFMDGMDGFAAGMGLIGFGSFSLLGFWAGDAEFALICAAIGFATAGFLVFNFPPAKIFMGDTGSSTLGFMAAVSMLWANREAIFPLWVGILIFSPFVIDATVTLVRRLVTRERFWLPHKQHYYQRVVQLGWGHRKTVLVEYALMICCAGSTLIATLVLSRRANWVLIGFWLAIYASIMFAIAHAERGHRISNARITE